MKVVRPLLIAVVSAAIGFVASGVGARSAAAESVRCPYAWGIQSESEKSLTYCKFQDPAFGDLFVDEACYRQGQKCPLIQALKKASSSLKLEMKEKGSPYAALCHQLGWKVLMGKLSDGSQVCVCEHSDKGGSAICSSLPGL